MKKYFIFAGILVGILLVMALVNPWTRPSLENAQASMAIDDDSSCVYLAENRDNNSFIYSLLRDGSVGYVHREPLAERGKRAAICQLTFMDNALWFVRVVGESTKGSFSSWELIRLDPENGAREVMYARSLDALTQPPTLSSDGTQIYVTFCAWDGSQAETFAFIQGDARSELRLEASAVPDEDGVFLSASFDGSKLYCSTSDGRVVWFGAARAGTNTVMSGGAPAALSVSGENLFFADSEGTLYHAIGGAATGLPAPEGIKRVLAGASAGIDGFAILADTDAGASVIWYDGKEFSSPQTPEVAPEQNLIFSLSLLSEPVGWLIVAAAVVLLLAGLCVSVRKFFPRVALAYACLAFLLMGAVIGSVYITTRENALARRAGENEAAAMSYAEALASLQGNYLEKGRRALAAKALAPRTSDGSGRVLVKATLLAVSEKDLLVAVSDTLPDGLDYVKGYDAVTADSIGKVFESGAGMSFIGGKAGQRVAVTATPVTQGRSIAGVLVVTSSMADIYGELDALFGAVIKVTGALTLAIYVFVLMATLLFARPLHLLKRQVNEIACGRYQITERVSGKGEIGDLWRSLQEMCVSLSIDEHKTKSMLTTYYRFVPQGLEKLFGRGSIVDIEYGEAETLAGDVGIVTVDNRGLLSMEADDSHLMDFVNACFNEVYPAAKEQGAVFLSDSFKLSGFHLTFPRSAADGVRFGLSLMSKKSDAPVKSKQKPEFSVILHSAGYLYGVTGMEDKAFSFFSSSELDFLTGMSPRLAELGVKLAVTDQYLAKLGGAFDTRYIGFVSSPDERHVLKLHEVLDVYPAHERQQRRQYDHRFQEALQLYYKNDFYLARNIFSALFKESPDDGVAQWYLFACEHFFNVSDLSNINYGIFGSEEKAVAEYCQV